MTNKDDKKKSAELERQAAEARRLADLDRQARDRALETAAAPTPLETEYEGERRRWLGGTSGKDGPVDYSKLSAVDFDLYGRASQQQQGERMGLGALQM